MPPKDDLPLESQPNALPDEIDPEKYVIGTYYVGVPIGLPIKEQEVTIIPPVLYIKPRFAAWGSWGMPRQGASFPCSQGMT